MKGKARTKLRKETRKLGRWLSNYDIQDLLICILNTFPGVMVGPPRAYEPWSVNDLVKSGIIGLYQEKKDEQG